MAWLVCEFGGHIGLCLGPALSLPPHASSNREQMATKRKWTWELDIGGGLSLSVPHFPPKAKNIYVPPVIFLFVIVWAIHVGAQG